LDYGWTRTEISALWIGSGSHNMTGRSSLDVGKLLLSRPGSPLQ